MSRSGYTEDYEHLALWRQAVTRAIEGKRGQAFLCEMLAALNALPAPRLIEGELQNEAGEVCAIGSVVIARGLDPASLNPEDPDWIGQQMGIARALAAEIAYENDEYWRSETPEQRFARIHNWVEACLIESGEGEG